MSLPDNTYFARRLLQLRRDRRMTQTSLARAAGLSRTAVWKLETEARLPTWETVRALAAALGVSTEAFRDPAEIIFQKAGK